MRSPYLPIAIEAVKAAEPVIMEHYQAGLEVAIKEDRTPVTVADQQAEEIIKQTILNSFPDHTFYGEEGEKVDLDNHEGFTWIIDPIDGTKGYIRGIPLFGTQLALLHDGELTVGVSNMPVLGELMYAAKDEGAFLNDTPVSVSATDGIGQAYLNSGRLKYFEEIDKITQLLDISRQVEWSRTIGDCWGYHLIAQGKADIMLEGEINFWDVAAAKVIVEAAGGMVTQFDGQPLSHKSTTSLATNGMLHSRTVTAMQNS